VARRRGQGSAEPRSLPLNGGLWLAVLVGAPLTLVTYFLAPLLFSAISSDPTVTKIGVPFLRTLYLGIIAVGMNNAFQGHWAGEEKPRIYMSIVLLMNVFNVVLNYMLIFGHFGAPALGATGAAVATVISLYVGTAANLVIGYSQLGKEGFLSAKPAPSFLATIFKVGLPSTVQEFFFSLGFVVLFWMIGQVGTEELAAANVLVRTTIVLTLLALSLGMASATLVSKAVGEGDFARAAQWGWDTGKLGVVGITLLGLPIFLFPAAFLSLFLSDAHTISIAVMPLRVVAATAGAYSLIYIFAYTLYSLGDGQRVMRISFCTQWLFFLPAVWIVGPYLHYGLLQIWLVTALYGAIATSLVTAVWADGKWQKIKI
jgi:MATE family multidrug resistance protein